MVDGQIRARGLEDERVLDAMLQVPRHLFVSEAMQHRAYDDCPLPIGEGQTISQPYIVARMMELLELHGDETVLEIGAGSGYQTALLSLLARRVVAIERIGTLARGARQRLDETSVEQVACEVAKRIGGTGQRHDVIAFSNLTLNGQTQV